ncbi:MAG: hypothetical protein RLY37_918, partial [Verrucomicrobiota bacterium]
KKPTVFKDLPPSLNAILTAREVWKQVRKKQLDAGATVDAAQVDAQSHGLTEEAAGRKLFELIAACRDAGIDPDSALRRQTSKVVAEAELRAPQG